MNKYKLSAPVLNKEEVYSVSKTIKAGWVSTAGHDIKEFEKKIANFSNTKFSIATNSGTSAIHLALKAAKVSKNDEVLVQSLTFVATVNPILYLGAKPIFFDVDENFNMKLNDIIDFLNLRTYFKNKKTINKKTKRVIKAVIVTNLWGNLQDFSKLKKICKSKNITIVEDAAEAFGSRIFLKKRLYHAGGLGDIGCFSFNGNKIITTGSGGAVVTNKKKTYDLINYLASQSRNDSFKYIHNSIGYNYKLNNLLAVLGISQMKKIEKFIKKKKRIFEWYCKNFQNTQDIKVMNYGKNVKSNFWLTIITFKKISKDLLKKLKDYLEKDKIEIRQVWRPNHLQKFLNTYEKFRLKDSVNIYNKSICLPSSINLSKKDISFISKKIKNFYLKKLKRQK